MVEECDADDEGIGKVEGWHGGELIDVLTAYPDGFGVPLAYRVFEAEVFGQEAGWHTGPEGEDEEGEEVGESHCATG